MDSIPSSELVERPVLFVSSVSDLYGAERSLLEIVAELGSGWAPRFFVPRRGRYSRAIERADYPLHLDWFPNQPRLSTLRLAWIIRTQRIKLVHANLHWAAPVAAAASRLAGVPFIVHLRNIVGRTADPRLARSTQRASAVICISRAVRDAALAAGLITSELEQRTYIIPDGRNLAPYQHGNGARIRAELGVDRHAPLIGMVARITPMKGQHVFLDMAALIAERVPSARFILVGDILQKAHAAYLTELEQRSKQPPLSGRVTLLGYRSDIADILAALDCFVHPSARGAFVSVLIEAMAAGLPIVVPNIDGIPECVGQAGAAELIEGTQAKAFADAVVKILQEPARKDRMSAAARARSEHYDAVGLARETERVFEHCLEPSSPRLSQPIRPST